MNIIKVVGTGVSGRAADVLGIDGKIISRIVNFVECDIKFLDEENFVYVKKDKNCAGPQGQSGEGHSS